MSDLSSQFSVRPNEPIIVLIVTAIAQAISHWNARFAVGALNNSLTLKYGDKLSSIVTSKT